MRIGVIGAGALGGLFGGYLHENGEDVVMYDIDKKHVERMNKDGLRIERPGKEDVVCHPTATTDPSTLGTVDVAFVFVKSIHTKSAMKSAAEMYDDETTIVTLQNGLKNVDIISEFTDEARILGGATTVGSSMEGPGHILHTGTGKTVLGGEDTAAAEALSERLTNAGFGTSVVSDPQAHIWHKQFISVGIKPVAALTGLLDGPLIEHEETRAAMRKLIEEGVEVAKANDIEILSDDPVEDAYETCEINYDTISSMLEDVEKGRLTEIDHINGAIVEFGAEANVDTPYNRLVTELVKGKEQSYDS